MADRPRTITWLTDKMWADMAVWDRAMHLASSNNGQREVGHNAGPFVEKVLKSVGLGKGYAWCAAFIYWCYIRAGADKDRLPNRWKAAAVRHWATWAAINKRLRAPGENPERGDLFFWLNANGTGHIGIVVAVGGNNPDPTWVSVKTVEGNTNKAGSREGDGVERKVRTRTWLEKRHRHGFIDMKPRMEE